MNGLTAEERETLGRLVNVFEADDASLNEWHPCSMCPHPGQPCSCSGRPWIAQPLAAAIDRIIAAREAAARRVGREEVVARVEALADEWHGNGDDLAPGDDWGDSMAGTVWADALRSHAQHLRALVAEFRAPDATSEARCSCVIGVCSEDGECCESHECPAVATEPRP